MAPNGIAGHGGSAGEKPLDFLSGRPVEGELLSRKLAREGLRLPEALQYAIEIGAILNQAHSAGRFYGSLSPSCIVVSSAGARLIKPSSAPGVESADFCAPERLRGGPPNRGSDVFAFGALLRWLIAHGGTRAGSESVERLIAELMEPDPLRRRRQLVRAVLELRLARSLLWRPPPGRNRRAPFAGKSGKALADVFFPARRVWRLLAAIAAITLFVLAAGAIAAVLLRDRGPASPVLKFTIVAPEDTEYMSAPAVSPDGARIVFPAIGPDGRRKLWLRSLDTLHTQAIPGTENGSAPFWSPDSSVIGFFASGYLRRVDLTGTTPENICAAESVAGGGAWSGDGTILFAPGSAGGLYRVPAEGGSPQPVLMPDPSKGVRACLWPKFLPGGHRFVFFEQTDVAETTGVYVGALGEAERYMLFRSESNAVYAASTGGESRGRGYLLFPKEGSLMSQAFSESRLQMEGDPVTVADDIGTLESLAPTPVSVSNNGVLAYQSAGRRTRQLAWVDRTGRILNFVGGPGDYGPPRISPDGRRIAVEKVSPDGMHAEALMLDVEGRAAPVVRVQSGVWSDENPGDGGAVSPDGKWLAYESHDSGRTEIYVQRYGGAPSSGKSRWQVSVEGGYSPRWCRDREEIYYLAATGDLMSAALRRLADGGLQFEGPRALFRTRLLPKTHNSFDVAPDGQRFLINLPLEDATSSPITVVTNWTTRLN